MVDIIFVHGETGDSYTTWVQEESGIYWPMQLLGQDIPEARIMTFGYDMDATKLISTGGQIRLQSVAEDLITHLVAYLPAGNSVCMILCCAMESNALTTHSSRIGR